MLVICEHSRKPSNAVIGPKGKFRNSLNLGGGPTAMTEEGRPGPAQGADEKKPRRDKGEIYRLIAELSCSLAA